MVLSLECVCCGETDLDLNHVVACPDGHMACVDCLRKGVEHATETRKPVACFSTCGCGKLYPHTAILRAVDDDKLRKAYDVAIASDAVITLDYLYRCPLCDNGVVLEDIDISSFDKLKCNHCETTVCLKCNKQDHEGVCDERRRSEELETERLLLRCVCGLPMVKSDGCNKMICTGCRRRLCWRCKKVLGAREVEGHFYNDNVGYHPEGAKCPLFGERAPDQEFEVNVVPPSLKRKRGLDVEPAVPKILDLSDVWGSCCEQEIGLPRKRAKKTKPTCLGIVKRTGIPCANGAKKANGYCGKHQRQVPL